jgi:hypothetical protein
MGASDPMILVDTRDVKLMSFTRLGTTECIKDNNNPVFTKQVHLEYVYDKKQMLRFTVLDVDNFETLPTEYLPNVRLTAKSYPGIIASFVIFQRYEFAISNGR